MKIGPVIVTPKEKILSYEVEIAQRNTCLLLETPTFVRFFLYNRTATEARLTLEFND
jgi:hypothetical protein